VFAPPTESNSIESDVFHVDGDLALAPTRAATHHNRKLFVLKTDDLAANDTASLRRIVSPTPSDPGPRQARPLTGNERKTFP